MVLNSCFRLKKATQLTYVSFSYKMGKKATLTLQIVLCCKTKVYKWFY